MGRSKECGRPTESSRQMRGAGDNFPEYIPEFRTEPFSAVGCDGMRPLFCRSITKTDQDCRPDGFCRTW